MKTKKESIDASRLIEWVMDARNRTFDLVADLSDAQLMVAKMEIVNPMIWEIGHVAWFQEKWVLRHMMKRKPILPFADSLYDSAKIPHDSRWDLPFPSRKKTLDYMENVRDEVVRVLKNEKLTPRLKYFVTLSVFHEDMHDEALTYTRQTMGYPSPKFTTSNGKLNWGKGGPLIGDVDIPGGEFMLGATEEEEFVFDNEKFAHKKRVKPFSIARAPVTQQQFLEFVEDDGYLRRELWTADGWAWKTKAGAEHPVYWKKSVDGKWMRRHFNRWIPLEPHHPVIHVNWFEADAYCRWAKRRLPTELEWEVASAAEPDDSGKKLSKVKRRFPWGNDLPTSNLANMEWWGMGTIDVACLPESDSPFGCRQMIGNVWEWTSTVFGPYPGFKTDPYKEYSKPWFGDHMVLRGGCWTTRARLIRNTWRNFYKPHRRDILAGFRTCAL